MTPQGPPYGSPYAPPQQQPPAGGVIDALVPTNPLAAIACWVGVFSCIVCIAGPLLGPIAIATGIISLKKGAIVQQSGYGKATSAVRSWIGIVTGAIGTIVGIIIIISAFTSRR